jgi:hypothetical protein
MKINILIKPEQKDHLEYKNIDLKAACFSSPKLSIIVYSKPARFIDCKLEKNWEKDLRREVRSIARADLQLKNKSEINVLVI